MWETREIERKLQQMLRELPLGESTGDAMYARYLEARDKLALDVLPNIPGAEPSLTDHSGRHIANVLDNAFRLLGGMGSFVGPSPILSGVELYVLCLSIIFHDVGNVFARDRHERAVGRVYDWVFGAGSNPSERRIVVSATRAHAGKTDTGSRDTLRQVPRTDSFRGEGVRLAELAAILRFADELAEGPQRTSRFMSDFGLYEADSEIYHRYARITQVHIDRGNERVALDYNLTVFAKAEEILVKVNELRQLLPFIYTRLVKLDLERQYTRHFAPSLQPFRATQAAFHFEINGEYHEPLLPPVTLEDQPVIPGEHAARDLASNAEYDVEEVCARVMNALEASVA